MKCLAAKAGEIKLTPRIFEAPGKLNVAYFNLHAFANCIKIIFLATALHALQYGPKILRNS